MRFTIDWKSGEVVPFSAEAHEEDHEDHDHDEHDHEDGEVTVSIEDIASEIAAPNSGSSVEVESDGSGAAGNNAGFFILSLLLMAACAM